MTRNDILQRVVDAAFVAFDQYAHDLRARRSVMQILANLETPGTERQGEGKRLPVCKQYLEGVLDVDVRLTSLRSLAASFKALEPMLEWKWRSTYDNTASENFLLSHANTMIVGPGGLEDRRDVWLGATLMAPKVRYPDHEHAPEETYLVLSEGEFQQGDSGWFSPGIGGSFYNPPGIKHAMRSGERPLFALWALLPDQPRH